MKFLLTILASVAVCQGKPVVENPRDGSSGSRVLYFQDNNPDGTSIISLSVSPQTGHVSNPIRTATGGKVSTFSLMAPRLLLVLIPVHTFWNNRFEESGSQNIDIDFLCGLCLRGWKPSLRREHRLLLLSRISKFRETIRSTLSLSASRAPSMESSPNTVTYSSRHNMVCAASTGVGASVTCFDVTPSGLRLRGDRIHLAPVNQTTPPDGPGGTVSDIVFNPSQTALFITIKSNSTAPGIYLRLSCKNRRVIVHSHRFPAAAAERSIFIHLPQRCSRRRLGHNLWSQPSEYFAKFHRHKRRKGIHSRAGSYVLDSLCTAVSCHLYHGRRQPEYYSPRPYKWKYPVCA